MEEVGEESKGDTEVPGGGGERRADNGDRVNGYRGDG